MIEPQDDLLAEIRESLRVDPAPGFARGVLDRIEAKRASSWRLWEMAAAAVVVIGAGVATALLMSRPMPANDVRVTAARAGNVRGALPADEPRAGADAGPAVTAAPAVAARRSRGSVPAAPKPREPEVLIPSDQAVLLQRLLEDVAEGRVVVPPRHAALDEPITISALQPLAPIEIPLIVVEPLPATVGS